MLRERHGSYKEGKLKELGLGDKVDHVVFQFYEDNFHFAATLLVAFGMCKDNLDFVGSKDSALKNPSSEEFVDIEGDILNYWGAYIYADMEVMAWVRSGKAAGKEGFKARIDAHLKAAVKKALGSCSDDEVITFYQRYPSLSVDENTLKYLREAKVARGYHENLKAKVGFAIDPQSDYSYLCDGSTFVWSKDILDYLSKKDCGSLKKIEEKKAELLTYFWEHVLERLMEEGKVVSWSAGSERYIGVGKVQSDVVAMDIEDDDDDEDL